MKSHALMGQLCLYEFAFKIQPTPGICESGKGGRGRREEVLFTAGKEPYSKISTKAEVAIQVHILWLEMLEAKMSHETQRGFQVGRPGRLEFENLTEGHLKKLHARKQKWTPGNSDARG